MRQIKLEETDQNELEKLYRESKNATVRKRSQCLLLSSQGISIDELASIFGVHRNTISRWFTSWEIGQKAALSIGSGRGRKKKLAGLEVELVKSYVAGHERVLNTVLAKLDQEQGVQISKKTLQRFLKIYWV